MEHNVFDYLNMTPEQKMEYFLETRSTLNFLPSYWINYDNVRKNMALYDLPELYMLDYLIGKTDEEVHNFFIERPSMLIMLPKLLGIRATRMNKGKLSVQDVHDHYKLDFKEIQQEDMPLYLKFLDESGLTWLFQSGIRKSVHDYAVGVESGLDSNGRKNRSGKMGESFLEAVLQDFAEEKEWLYNGQTTSKTVKTMYGLDLDETFNNRQFDGSLFNPKRKKLYLFEVNNFNAGGSKSKASATEFMDLSDRFSRTNHEFIYITDGKGWDTDKSHLLEAMEYIGKVFNYQMIEDGYLKDYLG